MKRPSRAATALALTALTLTACSGVTAAPAASGGGSSVPAICLSALDAADDVIEASMDVAMATADLIVEIAPALEAAMSWDADGLDPLIGATENVTDVTGRATSTVERVDYQGKAEQCRAEAGK